MIQALTVLLFTRGVSLGLTPAELGVFAPVFLIGTAALSLMVFGMFAPEKREASYA